MLEPVRMARLTAVLLEADERAALEALGRLGLVHLVLLRAGPGTAPREPPRPGDGASAWPGLLDRLEGLRGAFGIEGKRAPAREGPAEESEREVRRLEAEGAGLLARREELRQRAEELSATVRRLEPFGGLGIALARVGARELAVVRVGSVPEEALDGLRSGVGAGAVLLPLGRREGEARRPVVVLGAGAALPVLDAVLRAAGFADEALPPGQEGSIDDLLAEAARERERVEAERARVEGEVRRFAGTLGVAAGGLEARGRLERALEDARRCFPRTASALLLEGWIPEAEVPAAERCLRAATRGCVVESSRPGEDDEEVPVLLRSSRLLRPFERLVEGFGLPRYRELSPAPFLAVSYLVMFGMMFGDVGHGAVLAAVGLAGLATGRWRDPGLLLLLCGASSAVAGVVYGSWFGLERFRSLALWRDPLEGEPLHLLLAAMAVGAVVVSLGVILNVLERLRQHEPVAAWMGHTGLAGLAFYWAGLVLVAGLARGAAPSWPVVAVLLAAAAAWLVEAPLDAMRRRRRGALAAHGAGVAGSLVEAFETVLVYLANTISFVRLAAYGMSHAALLLAVGMTAHAVAPAGGPGLVLVLVAGNAIAILLEGIVAGVQALRLEYYEFFGKFFSGAGRPFEPFRLDLTGGGA